MFGVDWQGIIFRVSTDFSKDAPMKFTINGFEIPARFEKKVLLLKTKIEEHLCEVTKAQAELIRLATEDK